MKLSEKTEQIANAIELTSDDRKTLDVRAGFGKKAEESVGEVVCLTSSKQRDIKTRLGNTMTITDLYYQQETDPNKLFKLTPLFDLQNLFFSADPERSLNRVYEGTDGRELLSKIAVFRIDKVTPTGIFPMRYSLSAQQLGYAVDHQYSDAEHGLLRAKYRESDAMKAIRTDVTPADYDWLQIRHVFITPTE